MPHVALLGDSIFDNAAYTRGEPDVATHLREVLGRTWQVTLGAVDGATMRSMAPQLSRVPADATHLAVSVGGNDVLGHTDLLDRPVRSTAEALSLFAARVAEFEATYARTIDAVLALARPTIICTIYNGRLDAATATIARTGLTIFNDVIVRTALQHELRLVDLRLVCTEPEDYANPIEPSGRGGLKIARALARAILS